MNQKETAIKLIEKLSVLKLDLETAELQLALCSNLMDRLELEKEYDNIHNNVESALNQVKYLVANVEMASR